MLTVGIDPGSTATGWAVVRRHSGRFLLLDAGVIRTRSADPMPERLAKIHKGLLEVLDQARPEWVAIEAIFRHKSSESALRLGQARGVALLAASLRELPVAEYNPMTVKKSIAGHGRAGKAEVQSLVGRLCGLEAPLAADAADAAAIAMTHISHAHLRRLQRAAGARAR